MSEAWEKMKARSEKANKVIHVNIKTNADTIRTMSDKELAYVLANGCDGRECKDVDGNGEPCIQCYLAWLKSPAEDARHLRRLGHWYQSVKVEIKMADLGNGNGSGFGVGTPVYKCSVCKKGDMPKPRAYCPDCGARMDGAE